MREWQVGDPIGDGNDIGVPDIPYMGYLKDDEEVENNYHDRLSFDLTSAKHFFEKKDYKTAFLSLKSAWEYYSKMEKKITNPFDREWICELCCRIINNKADYYSDAMDIVRKNRYPVMLCRNCDYLYPAGYKCCIMCGKPLSTPGRSAETVADELREILEDRIYDERVIEKIVSKSLQLMKSNDSRLVEIRPGNYLDTDYVFEKRHRYFTTQYICAYSPEYVGPLVFYEFDVKHDYGRLLSDDGFKKLVRDTEIETGYKFRDCIGGYDDGIDYGDYGFIFKDKVDVSLRFDTPQGGIAIYDIDLDSMKLTDCRIY